MLSPNDIQSPGASDKYVSDNLNPFPFPSGSILERSEIAQSALDVLAVLGAFLVALFFGLLIAGLVFIFCIRTG